MKSHDDRQEKFLRKFSEKIFWENSNHQRVERDIVPGVKNHSGRVCIPCSQNGETLLNTHSVQWTVWGPCLKGGHKFSSRIEATLYPPKIKELKNKPRNDQTNPQMT